MGDAASTNSRRGSFLINSLDPNTGHRRSDHPEEGKVNYALQKKLADNSEAAVVLEGAMPFMPKIVSVFVRFKNPVVFQDLPEVDIPTRYIYLILGPTVEQGTTTCDESGYFTFEFSRLFRNCCLVYFWALSISVSIS